MYLRSSSRQTAMEADSAVHGAARFDDILQHILLYGITSLQSALEQVRESNRGG